MNKLAIAIGVVVLLAIGIVAWIMLQPKQQPATITTETDTVDQSETPGSAVPPSQNTDILQPSANEVQVLIQDFAFIPATVNIKKGTKVVWTNQDSIGHNVVSDAGAPAGGPPETAGLIGSGQSFEFTYDTVGTFPYHCMPHPNMQGKVVVTE